MRPVIVTDNRDFFARKEAVLCCHDTDVLLKALNRQTKEVDAIYYKVASVWGLSESAFWILYTIAKFPHECSQRDICSDLPIFKTTVNSAIQSLARKGYVFLERDSDSLRKKLYI